MGRNRKLITGNVPINLRFQKRAHYAKYTSMLNAMPQHERMAMFRNQPWMTEALGRLHKTAELITEIINRYFSPNRVPGASTETDKEQEPTW